jgi:DNA replication and repair protein RecF
MIIKSCELTSFRNIEKEKIEFSPTINVIYGENAQGKTNILEGIYIFARGKSFRAFKDKEIIRFGDSVAYSLIEYEKKNEKSTLGVEISRSQTKRFYKNGVKAERTADIIGEFRAVLFCPSHLGIVSDSASVRRNFLDVAISQLKPVYIKRMARYNSVISNRNAILKMSEEERAQYRSMIDIYAGELASLNADIADIRNEYVKKLDFYVKEFFGQMTNGKETPKITYESGAGAEDFESRERLKNKFLTLLSESYDREVKYGATLFGIHKDDLKIEINGKDARFYASQGQQRSLALAMKMAEGEISREHTGEYPVFLLDDVLSELDINRRKYILSNINNRQVIVTSCEPIVIENKDTNYICVENGRGRPAAELDKDTQTVTIIHDDIEPS